MRRTNDLGNDPVGRLVLRLALPTMLAQLVNVLYSIVDRIYISNIPEVGELALAGVGVCGPIVTLLSSFATLVGLGGSPIMAMRMGAGRKEEAGRILNTCFLLLLGLSAALTVGFLLMKNHLLQWFGTSPSTFGYGNTYLTIYIAGTLFALMAAGMNSFLICQGFSGLGMFTVLLGAVMNIVLDPIFIFLCDMGVAGAAWATVIAFVVSCAMASFWYLRSREMYITIRRSDYRPDARVCRGILSVGGPEALELSIMYLFNIFLNYMVIECGGTDMVGLYSTGWRVANFILIIAQSMGGAMVAVCAAEYGMRRFDMIWDAFRFSVGRSVVWTIVLSVVLVLGSGLLASVFTVSDDLAYLHDETARMFLFFALFLPVMSLVYTGSSLMQSIDKASGAMVNSLARNVIMSLAFLAATVTFGTLTSLWWAMALSEILGGVMMGAHAWLVLRRTEAREGGAPSP